MKADGPFGWSWDSTSSKPFDNPAVLMGLAHLWLSALEFIPCGKAAQALFIRECYM